MNQSTNRKLIAFMIDYQRDNDMRIVTWRVTDKNLIMVFDGSKKMIKLENIL